MIRPDPTGWFNAHCHLELSHLKGALKGARPFPEWLSDIVRLKRERTLEESSAAAQAAIERCRETGTTVLCDILSLDSSQAPLVEAARRGLKVVMFRELAGFHPLEAEQQLHAALNRQAVLTQLPPWAQQGLSPHAPYTVVPELFRLAARSAHTRGQWLCIHAAEVPEETEMLVEGKGALRDFLSPWLMPGWSPPGLRPIEYLDSLGCLGPTTLLAHCNDVADHELRILQRRGTSVVVCPGTHVYFDRGAFPLERLLGAGIPTFLGTDSLASNEDLDMAREVELAYELCDRRLPRERLAALASASRAAVFFAGPIA